MTLWSLVHMNSYKVIVNKIRQLLITSNGVGRHHRDYESMTITLPLTEYVDTWKVPSG